MNHRAPALSQRDTVCSTVASWQTRMSMQRFVYKWLSNVRVASGVRPVRSGVLEQLSSKH
jgi:hypothetical protein